MIRRGIYLSAIYLFISSIYLCPKIFANVALASVSEVEVDVAVDKNKVQIGDIINYKVTVITPHNFEIKEPISRQNRFDKFVIKDLKQKETKGSAKRQIITLIYKLVAYEVGLFKIPAHQVQYRRKGEQEWQMKKSKAIEIKVDSLIKDVEAAQLKPIKPKIGIWHNFLFWLAILILLCVGLVFLPNFLKRHKKKKKAFIPQKPAHIIALAELERLTTMDLLAKEKIKEFYEQLSDCIRRYLENRFNLRAPWMSTEEFLEKAKDADTLNKPQKILLKEFLLLSDLVKFARYGSSACEAQNSFSAAKEFIEQTKEQIFTKEKDKQ